MGDVKSPWECRASSIGCGQRVKREKKKKRRKKKRNKNSIVFRVVSGLARQQLCSTLHYTVSCLCNSQESNQLPFLAIIRQDTEAACFSSIQFHHFLRNPKQPPIWSVLPYTQTQPSPPGGYESMQPTNVGGLFWDKALCGCEIN